MEVVQDVCVSEGVCEVMCDVPSNDPQHEESMETHVVAEEATGDTKSGSLEEDSDVSGAGHGNADTSTPPSKPRFSYRWEAFNGYQFVYLFIELINVFRKAYRTPQIIVANFTINFEWGDIKISEFSQKFS